MKNLIISIICLLILMVPWGMYNRYAAATIDKYNGILARQTITSAESGNWQQAENSFELISKDWSEFRKISAYFIDTESLNDVDSCVSKVRCYITQRDTVNAVAEATDLTHKLDSLHQNEVPSVGNIF